MKLLLSTIVLLATAIGSAETLSVAFITPQETDAITKVVSLAEAELSQTLRVVERREIATLLKENGLTLTSQSSPEHLVVAGKLLKADVLILCVPVTNMDAQVRVLAVDSETGIRLIDDLVGFTEPEKAGKALVALAGNGCNKHKELSSATTFLSILPVRSAEPGDFLKPTCAALRIALERRIGSLPGVIILERTYTQAIQDEMFLSEKWQNRLKTSTTTLEIEIERAADGKTLNVSYGMRMNAGQPFWSSKATCLMTQLQELTDDMTQSLIKPLKAKNPAPTRSGKEEGEYFIRQAQMHFAQGDNQEALECAQAAHLFMPSARSCINLIASILVRTGRMNKKPLTEENLKASLEAVDYCRHPLCSEEPWDILWEAVVRSGHGNSHGIVAMYDARIRQIYRDMIFERLQRAKAGGQLKTHAAELRNALLSSQYYVQSFQDVMDLNEQWLELYTDAYRQPDSKTRDSVMQNLMGCLVSMATFKDEEILHARQFGTEGSKQWEDYCRRLQLLEPPARFAGALGLLETMPAEKHPDYIAQQFSPVVFLPQGAPMTKPSVELAMAAYTSLTLPQERRSLLILLDTLAKSGAQPNELLHGLVGHVVFFSFGDIVSNGTGTEKERHARFFEFVETIRQKVSLLPESPVREKTLERVKRRVDAQYLDMIDLYGSKEIWEKSRKLFHLEDLPFQLQGRNWVTVANPCVHNNRLYCLFRQGRQKAIHLLVYDLGTNEIRHLGKISCNDGSWLGVSEGFTMAISSGAVYAGSSYGLGLLVYPLNGDEPYRIDQKDGLPDTYIQSMVWADDRLIMGVGRFGSGGYAALAAYHPDTKRAEIIASSRRKDGTHPLDGKRIYSVTDMVWDTEENCVWFTVDNLGTMGGRSGLWKLSVNPKGYTYDHIWKAADEFSPFRLRRTAEGFLLVSRSWSRSVVLLKQPSLEPELVYAEPNELDKNIPKTRYPVAKCYRLAMESRVYALSGSLMVSSFAKGVAIAQKGKPPLLWARPDKSSRQLEDLIECSKGVIAVWQDQVWLIPHQTIQRIGNSGKEE